VDTVSLLGFISICTEPQYMPVRMQEGRLRNLEKELWDQEIFKGGYNNLLESYL
jgi:hypothetical protein